jgi:hypothetical protein
MVEFSNKDFGAFVGNPEVEREGVWFPITERGEEGPMFKLAFANVVNTEYASAFEKEFRKHRKLMQANNNNLPKHLTDPLMRQIMASVIIRDWKNVNDNAGVAIPPTMENKLAFLTAYPRVQETLIGLAKEPEYFSDSALVVDETDLGNSRKSSRGVSNTVPTPST